MEKFKCSINWKIIVKAENKEEAIIKAYELYNAQESKKEIIKVKELKK